MISADPEIVAPGEKGYFYCNMATIKGDITENTEYVFKPALKIEKSKNSIIRYNISDLSISEGDFLSPFNIIGRIDNNTDEDAGLPALYTVMMGHRSPRVEQMSLIWPWGRKRALI